MGLNPKRGRHKNRYHYPTQNHTTVCLSYLGRFYTLFQMKNLAPSVRLFFPLLFASSLFADPGSLLWHRRFSPVTYGDQEGPNPDHRFAGGRGSMNLAFYPEHLAVIGTDLSTPDNRYHLSILQAATGETLRSMPIRSDVGNSRSYLFPWAIVSASGDNIPGLTRIHWDAESGILFTGQGAYESAYTAYLPLSPDARSAEPAPPAYTFLQDHPGYQDAWGRSPAELWTTLGTARNPTPGKDPDIWGPSASYFGENYDPNVERKTRYDLDWQEIWGRQGSSHYNTSGIFSIQPQGPLIGLAKGAQWGHNQAGHFYLYNKYTGLKVLPGEVETPKNFQDIPLRPFSAGGVFLTEQRLYLIGPGEDRNGDNQLGAKRPEGVIPKVDQGLAVWAYDIEMQDLKPNDGIRGPAALETVQLSPAFAHSLPSPYTEDDTLESFGQSWYETDGFFRPKPMVEDTDGIWLSWKPSAAAGIHLVHATADGLNQIDLGIGQGMKGVDLWPKLQMADTPRGRRLVYASGNSRWRERIQPADIDAFMADFPVNRNGSVLFRDASEAAKQKARDRIQGGGAWSPNLSPHRGDAALAVVDPDSRKVLWTDNLSQRFPTLPANGFWTFIDRSHLAIAGEHAVFGFVDNSGETSTLLLAHYDLTSPTLPEPTVTRHPLGFSAEEFPGSALSDLQVADGRLYALVTQGNVFTLRDPRWQAQHILAIDPL